MSTGFIPDLTLSVPGFESPSNLEKHNGFFSLNNLIELTKLVRGLWWG
jgi:hypothetical protein